MNVNIISVATPPPAIYHGCSTRKTLWEEKFTPVNMTSCIRRNVRKHKEINNSEQYIYLDVSLEIDFLDRRGFTTSESRDYIGISGKGLTKSLTLITKNPNKKNRQGFPLLTLLANMSGIFSRSF